MRRPELIAALSGLFIACFVPAAFCDDDDTSFQNHEHAKDSVYTRIINETNAVYKISGVTNGIVPLASSNNLPKLWFPVGEDVTYNIYWGFIHVGTSHVTTEWVQQDGKLRLRIRHLTKTNRVVAQLYPVEDTIETLIDPGPFLPIYFRKSLSEGHYHADEITVFDHAAGLGSQGSFRNGHVKEFKIEHDTRDIVTLMFWLRKNPFTPGDKVNYRVMADEKIYDLRINVTTNETKKVSSYGKVAVTRIDPDASFNGLFVRKGKITVWVSNDPRRLCTEVEAEVPVANVHLTLDKVTGPGDDPWVKPRK